MLQGRPINSSTALGSVYVMAVWQVLKTVQYILVWCHWCTQSESKQT